jgi:hypothetical protein
VIKVCAWCNKAIGGDPAGTGPISHGICRDCAREVMSSRRTLRELIDTLDSPILIVDPRGHVVDANRAARNEQKRPFPALPVRPGELLECPNAAEPGGCGTGAYCLAGCTIRRSVARTLETGESLAGVEARHPVVREGNRTVARMLLSTEKVNGVVLLKIVEAEQAGAL